MAPMMNDSNAAPASDSVAAPTVAKGNKSLWEVPPEVLPNLDELVIEDGKPVDNQYVEKLQRLLTEALYSSWQGPDGLPFRVLSNVGLFYEPRRPPLSPDVMLSLRTPPLSDMSLRENRSYFVWVVGKVPDVIIEVVSDRTGGEGTYKLRQYAGMAVPYYVIYDPQVYLRQGVLRAFELNGRDYQPTSASWFARVGLGLVLWQGSYEGVEDTWLRWCDEHGQVIPTGRERSDEARQQAERERQRAERLAAQLRALGIDPSA